MSADWFDGMEESLVTETRQFGLTETSRPGFNPSQFQELMSATRDDQGVLNFSGTIAFSVDGYECTVLLNGQEVAGDDHKFLLDGYEGIGSHSWQQGVTTWQVTGWIDEMDENYCVIHPEIIQQI